MKILKITRIGLWLLVFPVWINTYISPKNDMYFWFFLLLAIVFHCFEHGFSDSILPSIKNGIKNISIVFGVILFWVMYLVISTRINNSGNNDCVEYYSGYETGWSDVCVAYEASGKNINILKVSTEYGGLNHGINI
jgi:hypothetical protein